MKSGEAIAFDLEVAVRDEDIAVGVVEVRNGAGNQKVGQLHLEKLRLLLQEEEGAIDRLDHHDVALVRPKVAHQEVKGVPLEREAVDLLVVGESVLVYEKRDCQLARLEHSDSVCRLWAVLTLQMLSTERGTDEIRRASYLEDWRLEVLLDD